MTIYCDCPSCRGEMMEVDGIEYQKSLRGCYARPMFQVIEVLFDDYSRAANWPEPMSFYDLEAR